MTGMEDFSDGASKKTKEESHFKNDLTHAEELCHTSSFIQNVLYEDSRAGVAVVDLFVAVKSAKDDLDILSKCNSELYYKISDLNEKTKVVRTEYKSLLEMTNKFLDKINEEDFVWNYNWLKRSTSSTLLLENHSEATKENDLKSVLDSPSLQKTENWTKEQNLKETVAACREEICRDCKSDKNLDLEENERTDDRRQDCEEKESERHMCPKCGKDWHWFGNLLRTLKDRPLSQLSILSEALLGSFLASFLWLSREKERPTSSSKSFKSSSPIRQTPEEEKESEAESLSLNLNESTVQMICDICEILNEAIFQEMHLKEMLRFSLKRPEQPDEDLDLSSWASHGTKLRDRSKTPSVKVPISHERTDLRRPLKKEIISSSGGTSSNPHFLNSGKETMSNSKTDENSKKAVVMETKEDSTSEDESEFEEALSTSFAALPQREAKAKPSVTCMGDLTKAVISKKSASTLTPTNHIMSSCMERISDEIKSKIKRIKSKTNVRVVEQPLEKSERTLEKSAGNVQFTISMNTPVGVFDISVVQYKKRRFPYRNVSEESFRNSTDVESIKTESNSAEDEMEEFLEIYMDNSKLKKKTEKVSPPQERGFMKTIVFKRGKAHFFEIQKSYQTYFVLEITPKIPKIKPGEGMDLEMFKSVVSCISDDKQEKQVLVEGPSSDLVIYIQVEVEEASSQVSGEVFMEYQTNSLGTQTLEENSKRSLLLDEKIIRLNGNDQDGQSLFHVWKGCDPSFSWEKEEEKNAFDEAFVSFEESEEEIEKKPAHALENTLFVKELKEKTMTCSGNLSEYFDEKEIQETHLEEKGNIMGAAQTLLVKKEKGQADVWYSQNALMQRINIVMAEPTPEVAPEIIKTINFNAAELKKALNLIHEIENDIVDVKLDDAISILPQLESELRKHLQSKIKNMGERESEAETTVDNFFSAVDFWPDGESAEENDGSCRSQERLENLLKLLSDLEEAVKFNEYSSKKIDICQFSSSRIYKLLHALSVSIRELEEHPSVTSLSRTLDIASQLDTVVREYDSIVKRQPLDYVPLEKKPRRKSKSLEEVEKVPVKHHLKNVRKKVFEIVEEEAFNLEGRIERDFDRLDRIERENDEAMMFLEAFLQKTERRMIELTNLKRERKDLSNSLNNLYKNLREKIMEKKEKDKKMEKKKEIEAKKESFQAIESTKSSPPVHSLRDLSPAVKEEPVRETISGLLIALDSLKSRAREKNEVCKEILFPTGFEKVQDSDNASRRSSRSSFTAKHAEKLTSSVKEYKRIGDTSLYLSWSEPEGILKDSIVGYQIYVNGKLNQKVRNPQRLQAVLYSIDFTKKTQVQLYALAENNPRILLATVG